MRFCVSNNRIAALSRVSSIALLGGLIAGCSSGFQRFDTTLYETAVPQQTAQVENPYPGGVDNLTTASTPRRFAPLVDVAPRQVPQGVYHNPEPVYVAPQSSAVYAPKPYEPYTLPQPQNYTPPVAGQSYSQSALPKAEVTAPVAAYAPPKPEITPQPVYIPQPKTDSVNTAAVQAVTPRTTQDGWSSAGGTTISVSQGETLYNISKRYGVPVSAIRSVNGMSPSADLRAGQNITIPNYVFSKTSDVSAPDNNSSTRAARASTGYIGEAKPADAVVPTRRPVQVAAISATGSVDESKKQRYVPKTLVSPPEKETTPDYSVVTGSVKPSSTGVYKVQSGDSLSRIASRNGTTVSALQAANGLSGTNLRIGQTLKLPTGVDPVTTASVPKETLPANVDPIVTGSLKPTSIDQDTPAPARTGISDFRWPVKGRVVSNFGENGSNGSNEGIDISVPEGTAVHAAENGVVIYVGDEISSYGKLILVRHTDDWVSAYAHNRDYEVKKGDNVRRGQIIARSGRTGNAGRPKLHFELRKNSTPVNPKKYLAG
jgi:murein DD-endopeptidase MepM/ murein hydrolase activator NlpD